MTLYSCHAIRLKEISHPWVHTKPMGTHKVALNVRGPCTDNLGSDTTCWGRKRAGRAGANKQTSINIHASTPSWTQKTSLIGSWVLTYIYYSIPLYFSDVGLQTHKWTTTWRTMNNLNTVFTPSNFLHSHKRLKIQTMIMYIIYKKISQAYPLNGRWGLCMMILAVKDNTFYVV